MVLLASLTGHVSTGAWAFVALAAAGTLGYLLGSLLGWLIGFYGGRGLLDLHGRRLHLPRSRIERVERWFSRLGAWAVFLGRITPLVRSFISIPAGAFRTPLASYSVLTLAGSAICCFALAGAGWGLGTSYQRVDHGFHHVDYAVVAVAALAVIAIVMLRHRSARRAGAVGAD